MPISENEAVDSECGWSARASDEMSPDQLDSPAAEKATLIVGRTRVTSAISIRPSRSGKYRSRAISSSATTAGSPDGSFARRTLCSIVELDPVHWPRRPDYRFNRLFRCARSCVAHTRYRGRHEPKRHRSGAGAVPGDRDLS